MSSYSFYTYSCFLIIYKSSLVEMDTLWITVSIIVGHFVYVKGNCNGAADIIIAVPSGYNVPDSEFNSFKDNLMNFLQYLNIDPAQSHIGLVRYGDRPDIVTTPQPFKTIPQLNDLIMTSLVRRDSRDGRSTNVAAVIDAMDKMAHITPQGYPTSIMRPQAKKIGILFAFKNATETPGVLEAATRAKANNMILHAIVATGSSTYGRQFPEMGTDSCRLFHMDSYQLSLPYLIPDLANTVCAELNPLIEITDGKCPLRLCNGSADIIIAVPSGYHFPDIELRSFEENLIDLMYYLNIEPDEINIGLIRYGSEPIAIAYPQPYKSRTQINTRITLLGQRSTQDGFGLNVPAAINAMDKMAHNPPPGFPVKIMRRNAKKIGILFTYENSTDAPGVIEAATMAKANGMLLHAIVATGQSSFGPQFQEIGTDNCRLFSMDSYNGSLSYLIPVLASTVCSELDPVVQVTSTNCQPNNYRKENPVPVSCNRENNMVQPDPNNCAYFYRCAFFDTRPLRFVCPMNTIFDPLTESCNFLNNVACHTDLQCPTNNQLHPHPLDCQKYLNCVPHGVPHVQSCPHGTLFDPMWSTCNDTLEVECVLPRVTVG